MINQRKRYVSQVTIGNEYFPSIFSYHFRYNGRASATVCFDYSATLSNFLLHAGESFFCIRINVIIRIKSPLEKSRQRPNIEPS